MSGRPDPALLQLAEAAGLHPAWRDAAGVERRVGGDTLRAVLEELGLSCGSAAQCRDSLAWLQAQEGENDTLILAREGGPVILPRQASLHYRLTWDTGETRSGTADPISPRRVALTPAAGPGYHRLEMGDLHCTLAVIPARAPSIRAWVVGAQVYALRRHGRALPGWEAGGDYSLLGQLATEAAREGAAGLAISPVHAMFSADPGRDSPYSPSSRLFLNAMYADPAAVFDAAFLQPLAGPVDASLVDASGCLNRPAIQALRLSQLRRLFDAFEHRQPKTGQEDFSGFLKQGGQALQDHACYEALHARFLPALGAGHGWMDWPAGYRDPQSGAVARFAGEHAPELRFHAFLQWLAARSLAAAQAQAGACMPIGLMADLAVGTDPRGSHAWSRQSQLMTGVSVGAPPDLFQPAGQNWGLTAFSPWALRRHGYAGFIETLRAVLAHAGGLRVDHIMGLARMWLVPSGAQASEGIYLGYPFDDMADLLVLEAWRHRAIVVGENLGTVPAGFNQALERRGILGMSVLWFEREAGDTPGFRPASQWPLQTMAMTATHDLPTVRGWWSGRDIEWREQRGDYDAAETAAQRHRRAAEKQQMWAALQASGRAGPDAAMPVEAPVAAMLGHVAAAPALLHHVALEDLTGQLEQANLPGGVPEGRVDPHPNWCRTLALPVEQLLVHGDAPELLRVIREARKEGDPEGAPAP